MACVKEIIAGIIKPFTHICNLSLKNGVFPDMMKTAKVIPLFKSGENNVFTNYRPVALLSQFSKVLERLFVKRLSKFIEKHDILSQSQYEEIDRCH